VVSPSSGAPSRFPHIYQAGLEQLRRMGLRVKELPHARSDPDTLYDNPQLRAQDVNAAFADPDVDMVLASIGGNDSVRILPFIDLNLVLANPKPFMGFSDTSTLLTYTASQGLVTLYGPSVMAGFAQLPALPTEFAEHLRRMLFEDTADYEYAPYPVWCEGYPDWREPEKVGQVNELRENRAGWTWLQGDRPTEGEAWGGCIEVLEMMKGTAYWPASHFFDGKVLFFETSEEVPPVDSVIYMLRNYGMQGVFDRASAVLFGRPRGYDDEAKARLHEGLVRVITREFGRPDMPVVANVDFGHTDPQLILPLGAPLRVDPREKRIRLVESALA
jgi:muramoyltetrapeptide carboxypeptidase LdcA involved in peptidoglycan recycling